MLKLYTRNILLYAVYVGFVSKYRFIGDVIIVVIIIIIINYYLACILARKENILKIAHEMLEIDAARKIKEFGKI